MFRGLRVMAWMVGVCDVPDAPANDEKFGRGGNNQGSGPFPQVRLTPGMLVLADRNTASGPHRDCHYRGEASATSSLSWVARNSSSGPSTAPPQSSLTPAPAPPRS
jgi:hypothetical protein